VTPGLETSADRERIGKQRETVRDFMLWASGNKIWLTLEKAQFAIKRNTGIFVPLPSLSARLRDLRKVQYGGFRVERRLLKRGLFEYAVFEPAPQAQLSLEETKR
jgi:hypothetical protein